MTQERSDTENFKYVRAKLPLAKVYVEFNCPKAGSLITRVVPANAGLLDADDAGEETIVELTVAPAETGRTIDVTEAVLGAAETGRFKFDAGRDEVVGAALGVAPLATLDVTPGED